MLGEGETVGLVPDALHQMEPVRPPRQNHRGGQARAEDLFMPLGQSDNRHSLAQAERLEHQHGPAQLPLSPIDDQEIRKAAKSPAGLGSRLGSRLLRRLPSPEAAGGEPLPWGANSPSRS